MFKGDTCLKTSHQQAQLNQFAGFCATQVVTLKTAFPQTGLQGDAGEIRGNKTIRPP